ncbi:hypothetical protein UlMin_032754 [Ulmus minor]
MLHCLNSPGNLDAGNCTEMTVLERQRTRMKWQQEQVPQQLGFNFSGSCDLSGGAGMFFPTAQNSQQLPGFQGLVGLGGGVEAVFGEAVNRPVKPDPGLENRWPEMDKFEIADTDFVSSGAGSFQISGAISRTASCPPKVAAAAVEPEKISSGAGRESFKKRKADKIVPDDHNNTREKKIKGSAEDGDSKITGQNSAKNNPNNRESSGDTSKENSKASEVQKPDYIHVRARRGQATDSHSLAERVRREKISERMRYLQDLVPGCNKITGKAGMLDEIINYVQSLQRQVEFLSMKLAAVNPRLDFNVDDLFAKEIFSSCNPNFETIGMSAEMSHSPYVQFNPAQQVVSCCGLEMEMNSPDMALRRTISAPVSIPETPCYPQLPTWDAELQNLFNVEFSQGRTPSFASQPFTGSIEASNLKMEM